MPIGSPSRRSSGRIGALRLILAGLLGVLAALLVSCGSSGAGLIPSANATPLQNDFEEVAQAAKNGNGSCAATEAAIAKTEHDFQGLPLSTDSGLRNTLRQGIANLRSRALVLCAQPLSQATVTSTSPRTTSTSTPTSTPATTPTVTQTTPTTTSTPTTSTPTTTSPAGGTQAPGAGEASPGAGGGAGGGTGVGESGAGGGSARGNPGAGGQEGGK
ncbi:MAG: hypothetical protein ABSG95_10220 [Solirubrobacteraceae bacterium]